jgi:elongation factor G
MEDVLEGKEPTIDEKEPSAKPPSPRSSSRSSAAPRSRIKAFSSLLDAVIDYLPSPLDIPGEKGELNGKPWVCKITDDAPFVGLAFKIATDPFIGRLAYVRVYQGVLKSGSYVLNSARDQERIARLVLMHANHRQEVNVLHAGEIGAIVGLKATTTGDTSPIRIPVVLERLVFPEPVLEEAVEPKTKADMEKMEVALTKLAEEDPTFRVHTDNETGQTIIGGVGELQLDVLIDRMRREFGVEANVGKPQVNYRETIKGSARPKAVTSSRPAAMVNTAMYGFASNRTRAKASNSSMPLSVAPFRRSSSSRLSKVLKMRLSRGIVAGYPVIDIKCDPLRWFLPRSR